LSRRPGRAVGEPASAKLRREILGRRVDPDRTLRHRSRWCSIGQRAASPHAASAGTSYRSWKRTSAATSTSMAAWKRVQALGRHRRTGFVHRSRSRGWWDSSLVFRDAEMISPQSGSRAGPEAWSSAHLCAMRRRSLPLRRRQHSFYKLWLDRRMVTRARTSALPRIHLIPRRSEARPHLPQAAPQGRRGLLDFGSDGAGSSCTQCSIMAWMRPESR